MEKVKTKVGINGLGRIGRAIFRINMITNNFEVVAVNDVNPSNQNLAYLLKYDSIYGRLSNKVDSDDGHLIIDDLKIRVIHENSIADVPWKEMGVDIVIDASGINENLIEGRKLKETGIRNVIVTHSPDDIDYTMIMGVNENQVDVKKHFLISSSICDANAFSPIMHILNEMYGVEYGFLTTLHPWLNYQNILDGPSRSFAYPGEIYSNFSLGRASTEALIPKTTSCISASKKVLPFIDDNFQSLSYRVPTPIVSSADISVKLKKEVTKEEVINMFKAYEEKQEMNIIHNNFEPLISKDFTASEFSAIIDQRWTDVNKYNFLKLILWYDNEWGYSHRVVDTVSFVDNKWK
jgi:glyceraldehyde 3-phosphate dehydrogenase